MIIKGLIDEDFVNYHIPAMFIASSKCDWKCCIEYGKTIDMCQNSPLYESKSIELSAEEIFRRYISNSITHALVIGGLEPMLQFDEVWDVIEYFRINGVNDDIVIYTGYYPDEISNKVEKLKKFPNIIIKFGRYIPNDEKHYDHVLGISLASKNQFAKRIS